MDPVKTSHGAPHGWLPAEPLASNDDPELCESDEPGEELCEATLVQLDSSAFEALFQKARA